MSTLRGYFKSKLRPKIIDYFHRFYYHSTDTWFKNTFLGYEIQQCPLEFAHPLFFKQESIRAVQFSILPASWT